MSVYPLFNQLVESNVLSIQVKIQYKACAYNSRPEPTPCQLTPFLFLGDDWSDCFQVKGLSLPTAPFIGFSALTGDVFDGHEYVLD